MIVENRYLKWMRWLWIAIVFLAEVIREIAVCVGMTIVICLQNAIANSGAACVGHHGSNLLQMQKAADERANTIERKLKAAERQITELRATAERNSKQSAEETRQALDRERMRGEVPDFLLLFNLEFFKF